jgi:glycosyltransferase involved in cell wall biosynthesis
MHASLRPKVTVVMPITTSPSTIRFALDSVLSQSFTLFEVWIIGDLDGEDVSSSIEKVGDPRIFTHHHPFDGSNEIELLTEGIRRARGEFVAYIDPSEIWLSNHLDVLVSFLETHDVDLCFSILQRISPENKSRVEIPLLPALSPLPHLSVTVHRKSIAEDFHYAANSGSRYWFDKVLFFKWLQAEEVRMDMVPLTTVLKFETESNGHEIPGLQPVYIDRLTRDPDFMNKELSALLVRAEQELNGIPTRKVLSNIIRLPLNHIMGWYPKLFFLQRRLSFLMDRTGQHNNLMQQSTQDRELEVLHKQ